MPSITITITAQQAQRLQDAWAVLNPDAEPLTLDTAKQLLIRELRAIVLLGERKAAEALLTDNPFDPT